MDKLRQMLLEMKDHLEHGIIPFWKLRGWDEQFGGYHTTYDAEGSIVNDPQRFIYTHCRQLWWYSFAYRTHSRDEETRRYVELGLEYLLKKFQRDIPGVWHWKRQRENDDVDPDCVLYGHSFVVYALSECYMALGDDHALKAARETYDVIQKYFSDGRNGGYYEFLNADFSLTESSEQWCDRKSLDGHLHLMEAYTNLTLVTGEDIHKRRLNEIVDVICKRLIDPKSGSGWNQVNLSYVPQEPVGIYKMWDPKARKAPLTGPVELTSYGHNAETAWLIHRACDVLHTNSAQYLTAIQGLLEHTLEHGVDWEYGGIYRYGLFSGPPTVDDKDFWPQAEGMVGFLYGYLLFRRPEYLEAVENIWTFVKEHLIIPGLGEWRSLVSRRGKVIDGFSGQPWKDGYHAGRSLSECVRIGAIILA